MGNWASKAQAHAVAADRSISDDFESYRNLVHLNTSEAKALCEKIKNRLLNEPVTEIDVETIWAFGSLEWMDAVLGNVFEFNVLETQPTGGYIFHFIENEKLQCPMGAVRIIEMWQQHKRCLQEKTDGQKLKTSLEALGRIA
jgi:hypothetical protein